jgi:hypothetical protein
MKKSNSPNTRKYYSIHLHCVLPILIGVIIYGLFRGIHLIDPSEKIFPLLKIKDSNFLIYNAPDGLWLYSLLSTMALIWNTHYSAQYYYWILLVIILSLLTECFQKVHLISGTYDFLDLTAYVLAIFSFFLNFRTTFNYINLITKTNKYEK